MKLKKIDGMDKIRLIFFSDGESEFRQFELNVRRAAVYFGLSQTGKP